MKYKMCPFGNNITKSSQRGLLNNIVMDYTANSNSASKLAQQQNDSLVIVLA